MRPTTRARLRASALLVPAVLAVVLGILGMHGLSTHGATAATGAGTPLVDTAPAAAAEHATSHTIDHAAGHSSGHAAGHADQHEHGGAGSTVMLCVAMLVAAAATLVTLLVRRSWPALTRAAQAPFARRSHPRPALPRVGTGPPSSWRFSVVRC